MEYSQLNNNRLQIQAMGIADFLKGVVQKIQEGYSLNLEDNDTYPGAYGGHFSVVLEGPVEVKEEDNKEVQTRGRKPKA